LAHWNWFGYLKRQRAFIKARRERTSISGVAYVFTATFLAVILVWVAAQVQYHFPQAHTLGQAYLAWYSESRP
jgi:cobalamin biosynthesis protein CobD/CbiB